MHIFYLQSTNFPPPPCFLTRDKNHALAVRHLCKQRLWSLLMLCFLDAVEMLCNIFQILLLFQFHVDIHTIFIQAPASFVSANAKQFLVDFNQS